MSTDDQVAARVEAELRAQGLTAAIDGEVTREVVAILGASDQHKRARRLAQLQRELAQLELRWTPGTEDGIGS
jgi:hypothetical protein